MLKECRSHGYFREEFCPHCGDEGKFLLNDEEVELLGRTMAGVLRHFPERYGLEMDAHGWVDLRDFLTAVQIRNRRFRFVRQHHVVVRIAQPVILEIDAKTARSSGVVIHKAGKTVYTSKEVPGEFLRRSHRVEEELPSEASADSTD